MVSQIEPLRSGVQSVFVAHPGTHLPSAQARVVLAHTRAFPDTPNRGSVISSGVDSPQPFAEGASRAQRPTPPTSTQRSSEKKKQSMSVMHEKIHALAPNKARALRAARPWLGKEEKALDATRHAQLTQALVASQALETMYAMRRELTALWSRSGATGEQLVKRLQDWCERAEASGIAPLAAFAVRLRSYA